MCCGTLSSPGISVLWADGGAGPAVAWLSIQHMLLPAVQAVFAVIHSSLITMRHREAALWLYCVPIRGQEDCGGKPKYCILSKPYPLHCRGTCAVVKPSACREGRTSLCSVLTPHCRECVPTSYSRHALGLGAASRSSVSHVIAGT